MSLEELLQDAIESDDGVCPGCGQMMGWEEYVHHVWNGECPTPMDCGSPDCAVHGGKPGDPMPDPPGVDEILIIDMGPLGGIEI